MLSYSHTAGYAILALGCIGSWKGDWVMSEQIHHCTGVPTPYLRKLLFLMSRAGLIRTKRGYRGGYVLTRPPEEITLLDVVRAVGSETPASDCLLGLAGCCEATPCPVYHFWKKERAKIEAKMASVTLADAARAVRAARWGKLTMCPPPDHVPGQAQGDTATVAGRRKSASGTAKRQEARPLPRKRR